MTRELVLKKVDLPGHIAVRSIALCGSEGPEIYYFEFLSSYHYIVLITKASYHHDIIVERE